MLMKKSILIVVAILCTNAAFSQTVYKYGLPKGKQFDRWSVGLIGGVMMLQSDIRDQGESANSAGNVKQNIVFGGHVNYQLTHSISFTAKAVFGEFNDDSDGPVYIKKYDTSAYLDYNCPMSEFSVLMGYSFGNISFIKRNSNLHFKLSAGLGMANTEPKLMYSYNGTDYLEYNNPKKVSNVVLPFGLGARYAFGKFNVGLDYVYRKTFTDNFEGLYISGSNYDGYSSFTAQVNYTIGKKKKAMEWVNPMEIVYNDLGEMRERVDSLTNDKDRDGVADIFDRDNTTPAGSKVYGDGTSIDTDADGIVDATDADPYSMRGAKVDATGKEIDTDGDGVPDSRDKDNATPAGTMVNFQGLTIGGKGGGGGDNITNENVTNNNGGVGFFPSVFFDLNKADIKNIYYDRFLTVARVMKMNPDLKIKIVGSTDQQGGNELNNKLGMKRAEAAKEHLIKVYGIDPARILTDSKGKNEPLASKDSKATDYLNRRIDFIIEAGDIKK